MKLIECAAKMAANIYDGGRRRSPEILTGLGVAGLFVTVGFAIKDTLKASKAIELKKEELGKEKLTPKETAETVWKYYIRTAVSGTASAACIVGAQNINSRRNAALATAYSLSETALREYKDKVVETIGERKEEAIRDSIAKDKIDKNPVTNREVIITGRGNCLCYESLTGRYFESDIELLRRAENELNKRLIYEMYISVNDYFEEIGLPTIEKWDDLGWNVNDDLLSFEYSTQLADDGRPCLVVSFRVAPKEDFKSSW